MARRFAHTCCKTNFTILVRQKQHVPQHHLACLDFLRPCPTCSTPPSPPPSPWEALRRELLHLFSRLLRNITDAKTMLFRNITNTKTSSSSEAAAGDLHSHELATAQDQVELLPHELAVCHVFSRLPLLDLLRAHCVCKQWRDSITFSSSPLFLHPDCHRPRLVVQHSSPQGQGTILAAFDPCINHWSLIPTPGFSDQYLCAASGGLFCYVSDVDKALFPRFLVGNPLTKLWRRLPPAPHSRPAPGAPYSHVAMMADPIAGSYRVILLCPSESGGSYLPLLYDSTTASWKARPVMPVIPNIPFHWDQPIVKLPDTLYAYNISTADILCYDVKTNLSSVETQLPYISSRFDLGDTGDNPFGRLPRMLVCGSRYFFVARLTGEQIVGRLPIVLHRPVGLSELLPDRSGWELIAETPQDLLQEVVGESEGTDFIAASNGCDCIWLILKGSSKMLAFDTVSLNWIVLAGCPAEYTFQPWNNMAFYEPLLWTASL